ncbi:ribonuclease H-like domain-containing protein [Tanacetum coccineum]
MDHGRDFDNEVQYGEFCNANSITHNFSAPRTPQSNGVVERKNRTLQEMKHGDGVASIKRRRRDFQSDDVKDFVTASGRSRLKEDLESSTWQRRHGFKAMPLRRFSFKYKTDFEVLKPDPTRDGNKTRTRRRSDPQTRIDWGIPELIGDGDGESPNYETGDGAGRKISESPWGSRSPLGTRIGMENDSPIGMGMGMGMRLINGDGDGCHEAEECRQNNLADQGNNKHKEKGEDGTEWVVRSKIEGKLANFILEKKFHTKGIGEMLDQHPPSQSTPANHAEGATEKEGPEGAESSSMDEEAPRSSIFYQPSKSSNLPFPSRVKKQKKDNEDERLLSIFK